ncbi:MAG: SpoIIE family protein phosphatase, partial [Verrucomicrobiota bacterium]
MGTNLYKHSKQGELLLRKLCSGNRLGIEILSLDRGPGIREMNKCMEDGYSTTGTKGNGLGSIKRLSMVFDIYSTAQGTVIVSQTWNSLPSSNDRSLELAAICIPYPGETLCGDAWSSNSSNASHTLMVADGLGHGKEAAEAADLAVSLFEENIELPPPLLLQKMHGALRSTRGAAITVVQLNVQTRKIICSGIGNVSSGCITGENSKSFVSLNGTVGHQAQRFQEFTYEWTPSSLLFFHSDGLQTRWKFDGYPGLKSRHPSLIAGVLYRDYRRGTDDVTVVVARENSSGTFA